MEGWFPGDLWVEMNSIWAGLGQLLNENKNKQSMAAYIDIKVAKFELSFWVVDNEKIMLLIEWYCNQ